MKLRGIISHKKNLRQATLVFLVKESKVLLAMKKRGFGINRWNGVGGKLKKGEDVMNAAIRETNEEIGVIIKQLKKVAILDFYFENNEDWDQQVIVYLVKDWVGEPTETEEMAPKWFEINNLPFDEMWGDDCYWLPHILKGLYIKGEFLFGKEDKLLEQQTTIVKSL